MNHISPVFKSLAVFWVFMNLTLSRVPLTLPAAAFTLAADFPWSLSYPPPIPFSGKRF